MCDWIQFTILLLSTPWQAVFMATDVGHRRQGLGLTLVTKLEELGIRNACRVGGMRSTHAWPCEHNELMMSCAAHELMMSCAELACPAGAASCYLCRFQLQRAYRHAHPTPARAVTPLHFRGGPQAPPRVVQGGLRTSTHTSKVGCAQARTRARTRRRRSKRWRRCKRRSAGSCRGCFGSCGACRWRCSSCASCWRGAAAWTRRPS
jgi:hypothetical protein